MSRIGLMTPPRLGPPLSAHQLDVLRLYVQLGTYEAVADYRGVQVAGIGNTLKIIRAKLGVDTTAEAIAWLREHPDG